MEMESQRMTRLNLLMIGYEPIASEGYTEVLGICSRTHCVVLALSTSGSGTRIT